MVQLDFSEIQSYLLHDYKEMGSSIYCLLQVTDNPAAKKFISSISDEITTAASSAGHVYVNIGFTSSGLRSLGLKEENQQSFIREFREGMVTEHRQRLLGDFHSSDPSYWLWGGTNNETIDLILMIFGKDESSAAEYYIKLKNEFSTGMKEIHLLRGYCLPGGKEHFGFREGISQPVIIGSGTKAINNDNIKAGEFLMGYKNEYDIYPDTPLLKDKQGDASLLPDDVAGSSYKDIGRNGTYFVLRQLQEDVDGFWSFLNERTKNEDGTFNYDESTKLAAKMMGRWPSGAPLIKHPDKDPGGSSDDNDFAYIETDKIGLKCPFGAHIRRTNPRDNFEETGPKESLKLTRRHRILRRTRTYGEDFTASAAHHNPAGEVGIFFGCFNADISRQFEFIQYTWANYPKFKQLYADPDPFVGVQEKPEPGTEQNFTIPQPIVNKVIGDLKRFVTVRGGAYFFFPSISSIKFFATI